MFLQEYEKLRVLGKGAFASVYKVRHADLGYVRALKVSHELIEGKDDKAWQTFLNECRMLLRIGNGAHPNIVRIYQPRLIENKAVVEMDYVEGESLCDYIAREKFIPFDEFRRFAEQIVGALAYCHIDIYRFMMDADADNLESDPNDGRKFLISPEKEKELIKKYQVIHNDLHSNNIIRRDYDGQYILLDFGLSIQEEHCVKSSSRGDGAIEYTAPEKLDQNQISTQSDIYSLSILLYEMLTGRVPFPCEGNTPESAHAKVYMAHLNQTPPDILELRKQAFEETHPGETYKKDLPEGLTDIIMKCLAKNPVDCFENAKALSESLKAYVGADNFHPQEESQMQNSSSDSYKLSKNEATLFFDDMKRRIRELEIRIDDLTNPKKQTKIDKAPETQQRNSSINWLVDNIKWLWIFVLCISLVVGGTCWFYDMYGDSRIIASSAMCVELACIIFPWVFRWKSLTLNIAALLLWSASLVAIICFSPEWTDSYMTFLGGLGFLGMVISLIINTKYLNFSKS